ncbi:MAG TPA: tetratricopeptide repeat protein [Candidatus Marinimicrobia bacterium]|nr:tetratricopeptide repeat protein [Candidatus Neomarinimicrobiota bacterium]HRS51754.1 tetratricopeptide repeat protein [Candidatus Neomarinimicrobiota bacterium]HRU93019.1 tetratricopeptide repeat protein [Candidatus Neomarinimicrobiota bacterium]
MKNFFGIFQDGLDLQIAHLVRDEDIIKIQSLGEVTLSEHLFGKKEIDKIPTIELSNTDLDIQSDLDLKEEGSDLPEISEFDELESDKLADEIREVNEERGTSTSELQRFLSNFSLETGKIALNANEEQISYHTFDAPLSLSAIKKKIKSEILSEEEVKSKKYAIGSIPNYDGTTLAFLHRGEFDLLNAILKVRPLISQKRFIFSFIDTNEIALMNLIRANYSFPETDYVLIIYVGSEYKAGIVMRNNTHVKTFKIIGDTNSRAENIRQVIYSKIILEQDVSNIPPVQHLILTGNMVRDEDLRFFSSKFGETTEVSRFEFKNINIATINRKYSPENIAKYAIPISLALKTADPKNKAFYNTNLLPAKIIENQKRFKIGWYGFILFIAIFYFTYSGTLRNLEDKREIVELQRQNYNIEAELRHKNTMFARANELSQQITSKRKSMDKIKIISGNKSQWHRTIIAFSDAFSKNPITWVNYLKSDTSGFMIQGVTNRKENIAYITRYFPGSIVSDVKTSEVQSIPVLLFVMNFSYADQEKWVMEVPKPAPIIPKAQEIPAKPPADQEKKPIAKESAPKLSETKSSSVSSQPPPPQSTPRVTPYTVYREAAETYLSGNIQEGYQKLSQFVEKYPDSPFTYGAKYLIGECLFLMGETTQAKDVFEEIANQDGAKTPDALLMLGRCYNALGDKAKAIDSWGMLITKYPQHKLAKMAEEKIKYVTEH